MVITSRAYNNGICRGMKSLTTSTCSWEMVLVCCWKQYEEASWHYSVIWYFGHCCSGANGAIQYFFTRTLNARRQWIKLISIAGCRCQNCLQIFRLSVVEEWEVCSVALVPVVRVAGFRFIAGGALLGLVYLTTQLNFYRITFFAAGRDEEQNKCSQLWWEDAPGETPVFLADLHMELGEYCGLFRFYKGTPSQMLLVLSNCYCQDWFLKGRVKQAMCNLLIFKTFEMNKGQNETFPVSVSPFHVN